MGSIQDCFLKFYFQNKLQSKKMHTQEVYNYLVKGVIDSGIKEDGGEACYNEIPKDRHILYAVLGVFLYFYFFRKWNWTLVDRANTQVLRSNWSEKILALISVYALGMTVYMKIITGKGMFVLNPCHVCILTLIVLCLAPSTQKMKKLHTLWSSWLFGATLSLVVPHLYGINQFQIFLYYLEHILIVPVGPLILYRRYGFLQPSFVNQMAAFSSMIMYQLCVLTPLSFLTQVNLNFALCHSPGDPFYPFFQENYFLFAMFYLNFASFLARWFYFCIVYSVGHLNKAVTANGNDI